MTRGNPRRAIASAVLAGLLAAGCSASEGPRLVVDAEPAAVPDAQLAAVDDAGYEAVMSGLKGRPVVVNVWASWCGPCRVEAPLLDRAAAGYAGRVSFLGVASKDQRGGADQFLRRYGIDYPNLFDGDGSVRAFLGLRGFPTTYFFDRDGRLVAADVGGVSEQKLAARVKDLLGR